MPVHRVSILGMELPVPHWSVGGIGILVLLGIGGVIYKHVIVTPPDVVSTAEVNARLASEIEEYGIHAMEEPTKHELLEDADGALAIRVYPDHCVLIQRKTARGMRTKLIPDLAKEPIRVSRVIERLQNHGVVYAAQPGCNRGCLNPHPGPFKWWYGERRGDWVEVVRQWPEGCQHIQMMHPPSGTWDTNPDGTPRVRWICCVH